MTALLLPSTPKYGHTQPRVAPPQPLMTHGPQVREYAEMIGVHLFPWQGVATDYMYALAPDRRWLYPEVAILASRQNGKTEILVAHIALRLLMGRRIMHTAQNRELPREVFHRVANVMEQHHVLLLPRNGVRVANGQESIRLTNGGAYRIVAPTRGGARGPANDDVVVDEVRELTNHEFIAAAEPTLSAAPNPQIVYLSNAGDDDSEVLNAIVARQDTDPALAVLGWMADPSLRDDDRLGWYQANPSIGYLPGKLEYLERKYESYRLANTLSIFETEHLCRWVGTMASPLVKGNAWAECEQPELEATPTLASVGMAVDPSGTRASVAVAWRRDDESIGLRLMFNVHGDPIDLDRLGKDVRDTCRRAKVRMVGHDPETDALLAKWLLRSEPITGQKAANAAARFVTLVESGTIRWEDAAAVGEDLAWTTRRERPDTGSFLAVRSSDERPVTAALAAIRAVWLASAPRPKSEPRPGVVSY